MKPALLLLVISVSMVSAQRSDSSSIEGKVLALENAWGQAEKVGDAKALHDLLDDSLVYVRYDGSVWNKSEYLASLKDASSRVEEAVNEDMSARVFGETALVTGVYRIKGVEKGKPYARRERFIDTWVHRENTWVCVATQVTLISNHGSPQRGQRAPML